MKLSSWLKVSLTELKEKKKIKPNLNTTKVLKNNSYIFKENLKLICGSIVDNLYEERIGSENINHTIFEIKSAIDNTQASVNNSEEDKEKEAFKVLPNTERFSDETREERVNEVQSDRMINCKEIENKAYNSNKLKKRLPIKKQTKLRLSKSKQGNLTKSVSLKQRSDKSDKEEKPYIIMVNSKPITTFDRLADQEFGINKAFTKTNTRMSKNFVRDIRRIQSGKLESLKGSSKDKRTSVHKTKLSKFKHWDIKTKEKDATVKDSFKNDVYPC